MINLLITSMIFFPDKTLDTGPADYGLISEDVFFETADKVELHGWFLKAPGEKGVVLHFHGNAGNISHRLFKVKGWVSRGYSVFLVDYRGYGRSKGKISHGGDILKDAEGAFGWLTGSRGFSPADIVTYGESLGSHPALYLAARHKLRAVILEAPYTSFYDLAKRHYPFVPAGMVRDFAFVNTELAEKIQSPVFIIHGEQDEICPFPMGKALYELAPEPRGFFAVPGGRHNDLPDIAGEDYWARPAEFLNSLKS